MASKTRRKTFGGGWAPNAKVLRKAEQKWGSIARPPLMVYQLRISLKGSRPPIWRRVEVSSKLNLDDLHMVIQAAMGWDNDHLHAFSTKDGRRFDGLYPDGSLPDPDPFGFGDEPTPLTTDVKLCELEDELREGMLYEYDFGDGWVHTIKLNKSREVDEHRHTPVCLSGKMACPPEDCGGVWGYYEKLEVLKDPDDPEHEELLEWMGEDFNPEAFDIEAVNKRLEGMFKKTKRG